MKLPPVTHLSTSITPRWYGTRPMRFGAARKNHAPEQITMEDVSRGRHGYKYKHSTVLRPYGDSPLGFNDGVTLSDFGGEFALEPLTTPIETFGMKSCVSLVMVGKTHQYHGHVAGAPIGYVGHYSEVLEALDNDVRAIYITLGTAPSTTATLNKTLRELKAVDESLLKKIRFKHFPKGARNPSVIAYNGRVYTLDSEPRIYGPGNLYQVGRFEIKGQMMCGDITSMIAGLLDD